MLPNGLIDWERLQLLRVPWDLTKYVTLETVSMGMVTTVRITLVRTEILVLDVIAIKIHS